MIVLAYYIILCLLSVVIFGKVNSGLAAKHRFRENAHIVGRTTIRPGRKAQGHEQHSVVFAPHQRSIAELEEVLMRVSDPSSSEYGKHWSREEIGRWSRNETAVQGLLDYLHSLETAGQAKIEHRSLFDEYITVSGPISLWESVFATSFHEYVHEDWDRQKILRAKEYSLPLEVDDHVAAVFNVVHFPVPTGSKSPSTIVPKKENPQLRRSLVTASGEITPTLLNAYYNITFNSGNNLTSQSVYATIQQTFSPSDLTFFQQQYKLPIQGIAANYGGYVRDDACTAANGGPTNCIEANLDVQYIMAVAQDVPTIYHYFYSASDQWLNFILETATLPTVPDVISISYGSYELLFTQSYVNSFNTEVMKLGIQGVSVLAADGDDGAAGYAIKDGSLACGYYAMFPACCPYVTSIGGTQGPEYNQKEITCQSDKGASITTGGGFSAFYPRPAWQAAFVNGYLNSVAGTSKAPVSGFPSTGRGFPDIAMVAVNYHVIADKTVYLVSGTSAACPAVAGMISLVNSGRRVARNNTMGWLNPFLYTYHKQFANDITVGWNNCTSNKLVCCAHGYSAAEGWDPVTGLGSINFEKFLAVAMSNSTMPDYISPTRTPTFAPTRNPTASPSAKPSTTKPSARPTALPTTRSPTFDPTALPTFRPSAIPTYVPTTSPSTEPTVIPTAQPTVISYFTAQVYHQIRNLTADPHFKNLDSVSKIISSISCSALKIDTSYCSTSIESIVSTSENVQQRLSGRMLQLNEMYSINATVNVVVPMSVVRQNFTTADQFHDALLANWEQAKISSSAEDLMISYLIADSLHKLNPTIFSKATVTSLSISPYGEISSFAPTQSPTFPPSISPTKAFTGINLSPPGDSSAWSLTKWVNTMWTDHNDVFILMICAGSGFFILLVLGIILMYCKNTNKIHPRTKLDHMKNSKILPARRTPPDRMFMIDPNLNQQHTAKLRS